MAATAGAAQRWRFAVRGRAIPHGAARRWSFDRATANLPKAVVRLTCDRGSPVKVLLIAVLATAIGGAGGARAEAAALLDSTGNVAARPFNDTMMLVTVSPGVLAPASIRSIYDAD